MIISKDYIENITYVYSLCREMMELLPFYHFVVSPYISTINLQHLYLKRQERELQVS
jgi:hypothetical protein